jgi:hypothetical protein
LPQHVIELSDSLLVLCEGTTKAVLLRCLRGLLFVAGGSFAILSNPILNLVQFRGANGFAWGIYYLCLGVLLLSYGLYELLLWRRIYIDLSSKEMEFRYGLFVDLWVSVRRFHEFDSIEVALNSATRRWEPYRVFLKQVCDGERIMLGAFWEKQDADSFAAQLSERTKLPLRAGVWR